ncbi:MAG: hypothetical protein Q8R92_10480 [Deltaproteobacteria bacterium]|nr:hypothetical protein [Deltaproteobacteria bacterium]
MKTEVGYPEERAASGWRLECQVHFARVGNGRKRLKVGGDLRPAVPGAVPRVARLLALAHRFEGLLRSGEIRDHADLASLAGVSRSRVTQIMNLLHLAPEIQESILGLPPTTKGRTPISERDLRPLAATPEWAKQQRMWARLCGRRGLDGVCGGNDRPR